MEEDLEFKKNANLKLKYLSNHWSDLPQILNLSLCDQTEL